MKHSEKNSAINSPSSPPPPCLEGIGSVGAEFVARLDYPEVVKTADGFENKVDEEKKELFLLLEKTYTNRPT